jgi:hypothetical protein
MIDNLLNAKKITQAEHDLYVLFEVNELGRKCKDRMMLETYMDEPTEKEFGGVGFAFYDGRRSVFRDVHRAILKVQQQIKEYNNDGNSKPESE